MDCSDSAEDYCNAWQVDDLQVPADAPKNSDQFFLSLELEVIAPPIQEDEDEDEEIYDEDRFTVESRDEITMWAPWPRVRNGNLPREKISSMLSAVGVPLHKQESMVDRISSCADEMANNPGNTNRRVLPMRVFVSIFTCLCYGEAVEDD